MVYGKNQTFVAEIASLTKIMTCYVSIRVCEELKLDPKNVFIKVSKFAT